MGEQNRQFLSSFFVIDRQELLVEKLIYCHQLDWYIPWFGDTTVAHTVWPTRKKKRNKTKMIGN